MELQLHFTIKCKKGGRMKGYHGLNEGNFFGIAYTTIRTDNNCYMFCFELATLDNTVGLGMCDISC